jgi:hypothetical protein
MSCTRSWATWGFRPACPRRPRPDLLHPPTGASPLAGGCWTPCSAGTSRPGISPRDTAGRVGRAESSEAGAGCVGALEALLRRGRRTWSASYTRSIEQLQARPRRPGEHFRAAGRAPGGDDGYTGRQTRQLSVLARSASMWHIRCVQLSCCWELQSGVRASRARWPGRPDRA